MNHSIIFLAKLSWRHAGNYRRLIVLVYLLLFVSNLSVLFIPFLYGSFINSLQRDGIHAVPYAGKYILIYLSLFVLQYSCLGPGRVWERKLAFYIGKNFFDHKFMQVLHLPIEWHTNNHTGSVINRFNKANNALKDYINNGSAYFRTIMQFLFSFFTIIYLSPFFGLIAALIGLVTIYLIFLFDKPFIKSLAALNENEHRITASLSDSLSNIFTIKVLRLGKEMRLELMKKVDHMYFSFRRNILISEKKWFIANLLVTLIYCITVFGYVYKNSGENETFYVGNLVTLIGVVNQFTNIFYNIAIQYNQIIRFNADMETVKEIDDSYNKNVKVNSDELFPENWVNVEIKHLQFTYERTANENEPLENGNNQSICILNNLNFQFKRGDKIALTGPSGTGKSTLLAVMKGIYWPGNQVELTVDGKLQNWSSLANSITLFPQVPEIFEQTIRYNISLGLSYTDDEIYAACKTVKFDEVLNKLPHGLDTLVQEKGVNLSVGQKQRLALARGVLAAKKSTIILLDEPTSSVDEQTEIEIYKGLFQEFQNKLVISTIHHLKLLEHFDRRIVLNKVSISSI